MRFLHLADVHIGAWRDPVLKELPLKAFERAVSFALDKKVDFVLIAGDLFNTSIPPLDMVKQTVGQLQRLKQASIAVYVVAGSHDYSPSGKTMLDVLEEAGLLVNVMKGDVVEHDGKERLALRFTTDPTTGVKLAGILGRAGGLDKRYYEDLDRDALEKTAGPKIFLFHAAITELKTKDLAHMESSPVSMLPKGFDYYAGGHVHIVGETSVPGYKNVVYPGPLFPASFSELEELSTGSAVLVEDWQMTRVPITVAERVVVSIDVEGKSLEQADVEVKRHADVDVKERIVLLRLQGTLSSGSPSHLALKEIFAAWHERGAVAILKNTAKLSTKDLDSPVAVTSSNDVEASIINESVGKVPIGITKEDEATLTRELLNILGEEQREGEKKYAYDERVAKAARERLTK